MRRLTIIDQTVLLLQPIRRWRFFVVPAIAVIVVAASMSATPASALPSENDMVDPDGDASGWEDVPSRGVLGERQHLANLVITQRNRDLEKQAGISKKNYEDAIANWAKNWGRNIVVESIPGLNLAMDLTQEIDAVDQHNRMVEALAAKNRQIDELEAKNAELEAKLDAVRAELEALQGPPSSAQKQRLESLNRRALKSTRLMELTHKRANELEQTQLRYGLSALQGIPRVCVTKDTFNDKKCGPGYEAWWALGRNILHRPRYCARSNNNYSCATGGNALFPENSLRPEFGEFKCRANGAVYWSNGRNAYSRIAESGRERCADIHSSWRFTGKFKPQTGGKITYRQLTDRDCPNQSENGRLTARCEENVVDVDPPGYPWGCLEHDKTGNWKCRGDSSYLRLEPIDTSKQDPRPKGDFTCRFNGLKYFSNGSQYMLKAAKSANVDQWLCRDVTLVLHVYCNGRAVRAVKPPNRQKQTCGYAAR